MEFGVSRDALLWVVPENCGESDLRHFVEWVQVMMANIDEINTVEVDLDAIAVEPDSHLWQSVVCEARKFGLKVQRIFKVGNETIKLTYCQPQGGF